MMFEESISKKPSVLRTARGIDRINWDEIVGYTIYTTPFNSYAYYK
jgi:hypothetical protein